MPTTDPATLVEALFVSDFRRIYSTLAKLLGDWDLAEESTHEAFAIAVEQWRIHGIPSKPVSWLISTGRFRAIDLLRAKGRLNKHAEHIARRIETIEQGNQGKGDHDVEDDRLRLIFACCHPSIDFQVQVPLTLREVCGLTTEEIASAFLVPTPTMAQRIVRGKKKIQAARIPIDIPSEEELPDRLHAVLSVVYLVYNEGYSASGGDTAVRSDLTQEAIRLCRLIVELLPDPEAMGLLALMLLQESRRATRVDANGDIVLLEEQDRSQWDQRLIQEGMAWIQLATQQRKLGPFQAHAWIGSFHATASHATETKWSEIIRWYGILQAISPSPVVELNRAVAVAMRDGPETGLALIEKLMSTGVLKDYHLIHAARADLYRRLGAWSEARECYENAISLCNQSAEKRFLARRLLEISACQKGR
ncbi:RNA polymerase sigma factor [Pirellula sp. SH-Sr6A]|uniref:RNA polymerase sigma factor n=1 Tax=Pirellula sp. SH-Sr6A TaxID=1632865 RepID=UPI00078D95C9|nr:RNA polymerase sigma factor [Pirellula sp. SH-Sr6A]AMV31347.1 RNA polymerase sigma factor [Pirellula sp. SH-Sr6A]